MKAGVAVGMAVLMAMVRESRAFPVSLLLVPDEETGSAASRELTVSIARRHRQVLVLEPSLDGAAKVARKACGVFEVSFRGRAAHAGLEPEKGASALAELSRFVAFLEGVATPADGTTLTATLAKAGSAVNVVPESASLTVDARAWTRAEASRVTEALAALSPRRERRGGERSRADSTGRRSSPRRPRRSSSRSRDGRPKTSASSWARHASAAPPTATSSPRPAFRRSTASARAAGERTPATSTCSSATCRVRAALLAALASAS